MFEWLFGESEKTKMKRFNEQLRRQAEMEEYVERKRQVSHISDSVIVNDVTELTVLPSHSTPAYMPIKE